MRHHPAAVSTRSFGCDSHNKKKKKKKKTPCDSLIAHLDMDAFYVPWSSAAPELKGKPVVVAGRGPRAVVTTASYEARKFGVFSATPAARARRLCPQAVFVPPDFDFYRARSAAVMAMLRAQVDTVEIGEP